jgi:hypothetical protein
MKCWARRRTPDVWRVPSESEPYLHTRSIRKSAVGGTLRKPSRDLCLVEGDPAVDAFIKACLYEQGHPEGRLTRSTDGRAYRWETLHNTPRPCPTAQLWRPTKPCHLSNGAQITVNGIGQIFLRCLHSECRSRSGGQRWYVGTVPASLLLRQRQEQSVLTNRMLHRTPMPEYLVRAQRWMLAEHHYYQRHQHGHINLDPRQGLCLLNSYVESWQRLDVMRHPGKASPLQNPLACMLQ